MTCFTDNGHAVILRHVETTELPVKISFVLSSNYLAQLYVPGLPKASWQITHVSHLYNVGIVLLKTGTFRRLGATYN